jgi:hypothetical protein
LGLQAIGDRNLLLSLADEALYASKRLGRNQIRTAADPAVAAPIDATELSAG